MLAVYEYNDKREPSFLRHHDAVDNKGLRGREVNYVWNTRIIRHTGGTK